MSPYQSLYGMEPPFLIRYKMSPYDEPSLQEMLQATDK